MTPNTVQIVVTLDCVGDNNEEKVYACSGYMQSLSEYFRPAD